jgi:hypothetical protein
MGREATGFFSSASTYGRSVVRVRVTGRFRDFSRGWADGAGLKGAAAAGPPRLADFAALPAAEEEEVLPAAEEAVVWLRGL